MNNGQLALFFECEDARRAARLMGNESDFRGGCVAGQPWCGQNRCPDEATQSPCHPRIGEFIAEIGGLGLSDIRAMRVSLPSLPPIIPQISPDPAWCPPSSTYTYATSLRHYLSAKRFQAPTDVRKRLHLPAHAKLVLLCFEKDSYLENAWTKQFEADVYGKIARAGFDLVTAFDFSIYTQHPRLEHRINIKRSLLTFQRLQQAGAPAIPYVTAFDDSDLDIWANWLDDNREVTMIAVNLQTLKQQPGARQEAIDMLLGLTDRVGRPLACLVAGVRDADTIARLRQQLRHVHIVNTNAYFGRYFGDGGLRQPRHKRKLPKSLVTLPYRLMPGRAVKEVDAQVVLCNLRDKNAGPGNRPSSPGNEHTRL